MGGGAVTETELQTEVIKIAKRFSWIWYHVPGAHSRRTKPGFPDLVLLHPATGRLLFAELKADKGKVSDTQQRWIDALTDGGHDVVVWRPEHLDSGAIARRLAPVARAA
jgi:hypothetical protein